MARENSGNPDGHGGNHSDGRGGNHSDSRGDNHSDGRGSNLPEEQEKEWTEVRRKKKNPRKEIRPIDRWKNATTLFVSNIPAAVRSQDLRAVFSEYGRVIDAVIPSRPAKSGSFFGFVRFHASQDPHLLIKSMGRVRIDNAIVGVSLPKYDREGNKIVREKVEIPRQSGSQKPIWGRKTETLENENITFRSAPFKEALTGIQTSGDCKKISLGYTVSKEVMYMQGNSVVGKVKSLESLNSIEDWVQTIEVYNTRIKYLGGLTVLICFWHRDDVNLFLKDNRKEILDFFDVFGIREGQEIEKERLAWVNIRGLPHTLCEKESYNQIGGLFGKVLSNSACSGFSNDFSQVSLCILVNEGVGCINERIEVLWNGRKWLVTAIEYTRSWAPKFISAGDNKSQSIKSPAQVINAEVSTRNDATVRVQEVSPINIRDDSMLDCNPSESQGEKEKSSSPTQTVEIPVVVISENPTVAVSENPGETSQVDVATCEAEADTSLLEQNRLKSFQYPMNINAISESLYSTGFSPPRRKKGTFKRRGRFPNGPPSNGPESPDPHGDHRPGKRLRVVEQPLKANDPGPNYLAGLENVTTPVSSAPSFPSAPPSNSRWWHA
ncbi:hypothetical protein SSX86_031480 [Deinandra increscens subsp. villosa]|uniref:RRM domain-containing protein n=1 Tax=Deinandra increscens subsp. villosa TaxID=3103831 RepID=A0AAP0C5G6_9ASTR